MIEVGFAYPIRELVLEREGTGMTSRPNVVFMLADNLGYGDLSCFGGSVPTPRIDTLASEGIRFTNFNTEAQCTPTRGGLLTGRMPIRTGAFRVPLPGEPGNYGMAPWEYTLADLLSDAGYATACYGKWHLGNVEGRFPTDQAFDEWWGISVSSDTGHTPPTRCTRPLARFSRCLNRRRVTCQTAVAKFDRDTRPFTLSNCTNVSLLPRPAQTALGSCAAPAARMFWRRL